MSKIGKAGYAPPSATMTYGIDNRLTNYNGALGVKAAGKEFSH